MSVIEIPAKLMLDAMLDELQLPRSTSRTIDRSDGTITVTVTFYPSARALQRTSKQKQFSSYPHATAQAAENQAVIQAIEYMECFEGKVLKDCTYSRLKKMQLRTDFLLNQLDDRDDQIKWLSKELNKSSSSVGALLQQVAEKDAQIKRLSKGWDTFIDDMCEPSERINGIVEANRFVGETDLEHHFISVLNEIDRVVSDLKRLTIEASWKIQTVGTFPYSSESDSVEDGSESEHTKESAAMVSTMGTVSISKHPF